MSDDSGTSPRHKAAYDTALATRNFEISLFWQRSLFFWGFIGAAFVGHAALRDANSRLALVLACFGLVCSVAWSLVNRGSKYWQEAWESRVDEAEEKVTGALFKVEAPLQDKGLWLSARRYSVSKLTIAMSDYSVVLWLALIAWEATRAVAPDAIDEGLRTFGVLAWLGFTLLYCVAIAVCGKSTPR